MTDSIYMGPWMADTIRQCDGLVDEMSYWAFSDVFEEQGVVKKPFYGGDYLIAAGKVSKPAFAAFKVLHQLGKAPRAGFRFCPSDSRHGWFPGSSGMESGRARSNGTAKTVVLRFNNLNGASHASISRVDQKHGDPHLYQKMGSPVYPTQAQFEKLRNSVSWGRPRSSK